MRRSFVCAVGLLAACGLCGPVAADTPVTNWDLQAVNADGSASNPLVGGDTIVIVEGICLNNPEDMLDPVNQWQVFIQGTGSDSGGTAAWAGSFFQSSIWASELARLNASGFREGDLIRITGYAMDSGGKSNINERHSAAPEINFAVELIQAGYGLPVPLATTIRQMNAFNATRLAGGEFYQCRRIGLDHVALQSGTWASNTKVTIVDPADPTQTMTLRLCNVDFGSQAPNTWFNIVGLGDQEATTDLTTNYQVWVTDANGIQVPGDCNLDGSINGSDLALLASHWGATTGGWTLGDFDESGAVDGTDLSLMASNWNYGPDAGAATMSFADALALYPAIPEPGTMAILGLAGGMAMLRRRSRR